MKRMLSHGNEDAPLVIKSNQTLEGLYRNSVHVEAGTLYIKGVIQGPVHILSGAKVVLSGVVQGPISLDRGANLLVEEPAEIQGPLANSGTAILRGILSGPHTGRGQIQIEGNGRIKGPKLS